jgi:acetolactate synthase-1/2/3 large subunit
MPAKQRLRGAAILIESLIEQKVDTVFGIPGGAVLQIYDELAGRRDKIKHVLVSHEQHAAHAADGYARSSGRPGVCIATSGPGATNLVTGIAAAYMDSSPVVAITGNVPLHLLGMDSFQEVDIAGVTMPVVKHNWIVKDVDELAEVIREAFIVAKTGRPGPVLIDIPADILAAEGEYVPGGTAVSAADGAHGRESGASVILGERARRLAERGERQTFTAADIERAVQMICAAKKPMIFAGGGVNISGANNEVVALADALGSPVAVSLMGIGAVPQNYRLCTGLIGMHGTVASNKAVQEADLLIACGARFSDRVTSRADHFARNAKILHFDIDPAEVNKNIKSDFFVIGDLKKILAAVLKKLPKTAASDWGVVEDRIAGWNEGGASKNAAAAGKRLETAPPLHPRFIIEETAARMSFNAIVVTDVGQHQMWAARWYPVARPRSFITSGGLGAMGFGLGAAIGAKLANPKRPAVLFSGDGSFRMNSAELSTLAANGLAVLIVVINNAGLGMVRQWQKLFCAGSYSAVDLSAVPNIPALAAAYGLPGFRAKTQGEFAEALRDAEVYLAAGKSAVIEAVIDAGEMVLPMVPGGKPLDEMIV